MKAHRTQLTFVLVLTLSIGFFSCSTKDTATSPPPGQGGTNIAVQILSPTALTTYSTDATPITISGTASGENSLTGVNWAVVGGASGSATGAASWTASVPLANLDNTIVVTATDDQGLSATDTLTVTYNENLRFTNLSVLTPTFLLAGQPDQVRVSYGIEPEPNLITSSVHLLKVDASGNVMETLNQMTDDGDLFNGDDIFGDGNFSTIQDFNEITEGTVRLRVSAQTDDGGNIQTAYSPVFTLQVLSAPSDIDMQEVLDAQSNGWMTYQGYLITNPDEAVQMTVDWLKTQSNVLDAGLNEDQDVIWIEYALGIEGSLYLRDWKT